MNKLIALGDKGQVRFNFNAIEFNAGRIVNRAGNAECNIAGHLLQLLTTVSGLDEFEPDLLNDLADKDLLEFIELIGVGLQLHFGYPAVFVRFDLTSAPVATSVLD
jgi:hypothetical protein